MANKDKGSIPDMYPPDEPPMRVVRGHSNKLSPLTAVALACLVAALALGLTGRLGAVAISPEQVAVKVNYLSGTTTTLLDPGYKFFLPFVHDVYVIDKRVQNFEMAGSGFTNEANVPELTVRANDGSNFRFNSIEIQYQVDPRRAEEVLATSGPGDGYKAEWVKSHARSILRDEFGRFTAEEIADPGKLQIAFAACEERLNAALTPYGLRIVDIPQQKPIFDQAYESSIEDRKVADQDVERLIAMEEQLRQERDQRFAMVEREKSIEMESLHGELDRERLTAERDATRMRSAAEAFRIDRTADGAAQLAELTARARTRRQVHEGGRGCARSGRRTRPARRSRRSRGSDRKARSHPLHLHSLQQGPGARATRTRRRSQRRPVPDSRRRAPVKRTLAIVVVLASLAVVLLIVLSSLLVTKIPPAVIGVKQNLLAGGIVQKDHRTGFHLGIAFVHKWYQLDGRVHFINFSKEADHGGGVDSNVSNTGSLEIRTSDNNTASLDVTVMYRIVPEGGYRIVEDGIQIDYRDRVLRSVRGLLMKELPKLSPEDLVNSTTRLQRVEETVELMRVELAQYHVEPLGVLIRAARFPPDYEEKLQAKQLTRQDALLALARQRQERQQQVTESYEKETEALEKRRRGEWDVRLQEARSQNQIKIAEITSQARIFDQQTRADAEAAYVSAIATGELELAKAEALRDELRNAALDSDGGRILLAKRAAENLVIGDVTLNSNDPSVPKVLDLGAMVDLLLGRQP